MLILQILVRCDTGKTSRHDGRQTKALLDGCVLQRVNFAVAARAIVCQLQDMEVVPGTPQSAWKPHRGCS
jgi:hypothetical protein